MQNEFVLEMKNIGKTYGNNTVLSDVSLSVKPGEIHALLGENGAGKSTLMNILFGMPVIHATGGFEGEVYLDGEKVNIMSPLDAMHKGIGMVHQEFMLLPGFTITENIKLNREITRPNVVSRVLNKNLETLDTANMASDARKALDSVAMGIEEHTMVHGLPVGYMQFVEIAREIDKTGVKLLVFDEPTAVLTESEADQLVTVMKAIAASGIAIIFITHRLDEVMAASNNITILRDGRLVATRKVEDTNIVDLAELMIGRKGESVVDAQPREVQSSKVALHLGDLEVDMPGEAVRGVTLDVMDRKNTVDAISHLKDEANMQMLTQLGIYNETELESRYDILLEGYTKTIRVEALTSLKMVKNEIYPAIVKYIEQLANTSNALSASNINNEFLIDDLTEFSKLMSDVKSAIRELEVAVYEFDHSTNPVLEKSIFARDNIVTAMAKLRKLVDMAETKVDSNLWPIPSYVDLLFGI